MAHTASLFRDIVELSTDRLTLRLPKEFTNRRIEVLVVPLDDLPPPTTPVSTQGKGWPPGYFDRLMGSVPGFPDSDLKDPLDPRDSAVWDTAGDDGG